MSNETQKSETLIRSGISELKWRISRNKKDLLVILGWTIAITLIIVKTHQIFYLTNERFLKRQVGFLTYDGPVFSELDLLLITVVSFFVAISVSKFKSIILGYFASITLSFLLSVFYTFLYIWFILQLDQVFAQLPYGWEWVLFMAIINVFRFMIPLGITFILIGAVVGAFTRMVINPQ
ncbi:MAG: hypothetical protein JSV64_08155 [Candidatus Bathyarchaeota archaeon]|nr:MAG: hypothetical protein JSV64_08155 [Candidatus Bathyarchaeota archaeon]